MEAVGSEKLSPILVFAMASPQSLQKSVASRMTSWMNCGSSKVSSSIISGLRSNIAMVQGPTATAPMAAGGAALTSAAHCSRKPGSRAVLYGSGITSLARLRLVLEHVRLDGRHDVVGVLHPAPERLRFLGEVVVGEHHVWLVALVVVHHRGDGLGRIGAVLLDALAVERARERRDDRVDGHAIGERALVGGHHAVAIREARLAGRVPELVHLHLPGRGLDVEHEGLVLSSRSGDCAVWGRGYGACRSLSRRRRVRADSARRMTRVIALDAARSGWK